MRKIPFDASLIGKPGITVKIDGEVPRYIEYIPKRESRYTVAVVESDGDANNYEPTHTGFTMYRQTRSAEEIAKEVFDKLRGKEQRYLVPFEEQNDKSLLISLVQAGMDEVTDTATGTSTVTNANKFDTLT